MVIKELVALTMVCFFISACTVNPRVPLSPQNHVQLDNVFGLNVPWTPRLTEPVAERPVMLGVVLFDGTRNDRLNVPQDERQTVVAHLYERLYENESIEFIDYYTGAGTQSFPLSAGMDTATGYTVKDTAERAANKVIRTIERERFDNPELDVRLLVSGFSRGGAAARHFMNVLERRWENKKSTEAPPRFYALIFDTVATGSANKLLLQVPNLADMFYHFVSLDERRFFFQPILDKPLNPNQNRITTFNLPGVHSDIGSSYNSGVGSEYLAHIDSLLAGMGLLSQDCFSVKGDSRAQGKNDSRWLLEQLLGIGAPDTEPDTARKSNLLNAEPLPHGFWPDWNERMWSLQFKNGMSNWRCTRRQGVQMPEFQITNTRNGYVMESSNSQFQSNEAIIVENERYFVTYTVGGVISNKLEIDASTLQQIGEGESASLAVGIVIEPDGQNQLWWFLDDERVQQI